MESPAPKELENFRNSVGIKFQLYNSLFISLPFHRIEKTGILLSLFLNHCEEGYTRGNSPSEIVEAFFQRYATLKNQNEQTDLLLRFIQYVERQVVLFDALEDAAFSEINDLNGPGTLKGLEARVRQLGKEKSLREQLDHFKVALVLTAHPTQFYTGPVLGIINDLSNALRNNQTNEVNIFLQQLGKTPLTKKQKPTPYDEAVSLIWYLENVFYNAVGQILSSLREEFGHEPSQNPVIVLGFWPGGDRDGNPNVHAETTLRVAESLRGALIRSYYRDVRRLKRRLTFRGVDEMISELESVLYRHIFLPGSETGLRAETLHQSLSRIREILVLQHNGLFLSHLDNLIDKVNAFGLHFASLDIRQESSVHGKVLQEICQREALMSGDYASASAEEKIRFLTGISRQAEVSGYEGMTRETLDSVAAMRSIQEMNGEKACNRYIISQCGSAVNVLEVYTLLVLGGWQPPQLPVNIVPLFETIDDLEGAAGIMRTLYANEVYRAHLNRRKGVQTIMLGFSDGTKDGGYLMANWSIYKAKEELTAVSREAGFDVIFFDGRGGPPARGGGKTHKFYASMGRNISSREIHLTIQGQTVSSSFGTAESARFNIEQLLHAGLSNVLHAGRAQTLTPQQESTLQVLAQNSYRAYRELKDDPAFLEYLAAVSPLNYYSDANISSRPSKRSAGTRLSLKDLRAIPFVGAWSQIKQNVPGFYGMGYALEALEREGRWEEARMLYRESAYFRTLVDNCEMAMKKSYFPLTAHLSQDPDYAPLWKRIRDEFERTEKMLLRLTGNRELMQDYPVENLSIQMRERIVLPLTTIQQYALSQLRKEGGENTERAVWERLVVRTSFGIINAGRNSV